MRAIGFLSFGLMCFVAGWATHEYYFPGIADLAAIYAPHNKP